MYGCSESTLGRLALGPPGQSAGPVDEIGRRGNRSVVRGVRSLSPGDRCPNRKLVRDRAGPTVWPAHPPRPASPPCARPRGAEPLDLLAPHERPPQAGWPHPETSRLPTAAATATDTACGSTRRSANARHCNGRGVEDRFDQALTARSTWFSEMTTGSRQAPSTSSRSTSASPAQAAYDGSSQRRSPARSVGGRGSAPSKRTKVDDHRRSSVSRRTTAARLAETRSTTSDAQRLGGLRRSLPRPRARPHRRGRPPAAAAAGRRRASTPSLASMPIELVHHDGQRSVTSAELAEVALVQRGVRVLLRVDHPDHQVRVLDDAVDAWSCCVRTVSWSGRSSRIRPDSSGSSGRGRASVRSGQPRRWWNAKPVEQSGSCGVGWTGLRPRRRRSTSSVDGRRTPTGDNGTPDEGVEQRRLPAARTPGECDHGVHGGATEPCLCPFEHDAGRRGVGGTEPVASQGDRPRSSAARRSGRVAVWPRRSRGGVTVMQRLLDRIGGIAARRARRRRRPSAQPRRPVRRVRRTARCPVGPPARPASTSTRRA